MAASQIPNLLDTLRASRTARGGNAGGRRGGASGTSRGNEPLSSESKDKIVQQTDEDASGSRLSAVEAGYLDDAFAHVFYTNANSPEIPRRMPIINRGTYVRTTALDALVTQFLSLYSGKSTQIISLGAGTDTRPFRLFQRSPELVNTLTYHELDFPQTTVKKVRTIMRTPFAKSLVIRQPQAEGTDIQCVHIRQDETALYISAYNIHPLDLRDLAPASSIAPPPEQQTTTPSSPPITKITNVDAKTPILILSECCLTYLPSRAGSSILKHITSTLLDPSTPVLTVLYEPLHPNDAFGRTMTRNLRSRGIDMPSLLELEDLEAHGSRLTACLTSEGSGAVGWGGLEVRQVWKEWISEEEKERLRLLEGLDEEEEWELLAGHYGIIWAWRGMDGETFGKPR